MTSHTLPNGSAPGGGVTNDATVRLSDHAEYRATRTNVNSAFVRTTIAKLAREVYTDYGGEGISVPVLAGAGPQDGQRGQTSLSSHSASDPAGLGQRSDHHGPHRPLRQNWPALTLGVPGIILPTPPTLAGVSERLQKALTGMLADQELNASVDGKWAKQSEDAMVNVLAHDLRLCLAQWPASEKRYDGVLREQLAPRALSRPAAADHGRPLCGACQAIVGHGRDYLVRVKGNQPTVLAALTDGFAGEEPGEPQAETLGKKRA